MKSTAPVVFSLITNRKGWSATKSVGMAKDSKTMTPAVVAAASVPSSLTSMNDLWKMLETYRP
uniref:Uncharacterized protein n=1 Tax=Kalanchoe fedtschenkoi TaxID=63787 RepID=A0A7N0SXQ2_KALFE